MNLIHESRAGQSTTYDWDYENRLTKITHPNGTTVQHEYSIDGNRLSRSQGGIKTGSCIERWFKGGHTNAQIQMQGVQEHDSRGRLSPSQSSG
ncbi:MAG: hypothetical protein ACE5QW_09350 [Thermoplasmata archaeon]